MRVTLADVAATPSTDQPPPCPQCGARGFHIHQHSWKSVKDPFIDRVLVARYRCKNCGYVRRLYPAGITADRQSIALEQLSVLLYCLGLSYQGTRAALVDLGCPLAMTSIRRNVIAARRSVQAELPTGDFQFSPTGGGWLRGPDGAVQLRLVRPTASSRLLDAEIEPGPTAGEIHRQVDACARWVMLSLGADLRIEVGEVRRAEDEAERIMDAQVRIAARESSARHAGGFPGRQQTSGDRSDI